MYIFIFLFFSLLFFLLTDARLITDLKRVVSITIKQGVEARDYNELAEAEKLKPLELTMRKVEDLTQSVLNSFEYLKRREEEMRDTNGKLQWSFIFILFVFYFSLF